MKPVLGALVAAALALPAAAQAQFGPPELIEAARREGKLVFYSANVAESETPMIKAFNKRFPFIKIEFLRAPGNQLLQRIKTEAAAGKLLADVIDHSDRSLMLEIENCSRTMRRPMPRTTCPRRACRRSCGRALPRCGRSPTIPSW
jgi:hypothetical protein